ncbi:mitochondrial ribosome-associated GTPase 2 isoform X2 [Nylanderia fulva]|uniref:mitochondrial ribosome-associated GTPase 2 isoform X2 n=1 Tax=Nylanderia fulva TaxID=613905 RepID=UPI0010FB7A1D|nr:mitochondrial ribosome-associated GTPase 2 isoform X2 [Nylanderia fulva]
MKISIFNEDDSVLLVGEGNFSFSVALLRCNLNINLIATCYESNVSQETTKENVNYLRSNGICVLFDVDATKLEECLALKSKLFDKIIFNFPHIGGKMRIEKNRELLKNFFLSSEKMIKENGQILVTLCNGQGGTPMDKPKRRWDDSWKIVEMAAHGNFILTKMHCLHHLRNIITCNVVQRQGCEIILNRNKYEISNRNLFRTLSVTACVHKEKSIPKPLRSTKPKSQHDTVQYFVDIKQTRTIGGKGGDGEISFLRLWVNDRAGPDGGDGGNGGHVIFQAKTNVKDLRYVSSLIKAENGEKGYTKDCFGKNAEHTVVEVPIGTIMRDIKGRILADLDQDGIMFIAARGGAGGHGNAFFKSDTQQSPEVCEYGAVGEDLQYVIEVRSMAHIGLIGLPNAGKSTLLRAISRARPKVAAYPFTTLKPHIGMIQYDDYEQVAVADMPGLIEDSHKNKGLGITFLKHAERCAALIFILDITQDEPWKSLEILKYEINQFNERLSNRPHIVVANKIDLPDAEINLQLLKKYVDLPIIPVSAKLGTNVSTLLKEIRILYDNLKSNTSEENDNVLA